MGTELSKRSLQRYKKKVNSRGYIRVWKVVNVSNKKYYPEFKHRNKSFKPGLNISKYAEGDISGCHIHAFRDRQSAKKWCDCYRITISCLVKPEDISAIGRAGRLKTLTTRRIIMPKYPSRCAKR